MVGMQTSGGAEPSFVRFAIIAAAAAAPTAIPSVLDCPSGIAASEASRRRFEGRRLSREIGHQHVVGRDDRGGFRDAPAGALTVPRYGSYLPDIELTASNTASWVIVMNRAAVNGGPFGRIALIAISFHSRTTASLVTAAAFAGHFATFSRQALCL